MLKEFFAFINRGNVIDLAVAVIIGGAFGAITTSLVNQVIMPIIGMLVGGVDFSQLGIILRDRHLYTTVAQAVEAGVPVIQLGAFINTVVNFLIIAFVLFMIIRSINSVQKALTRKRIEEEAAAPPPPPTAEEVLLREIRDLLKDRPAA